MSNSLTVTIEATQESLQQRLGEATRARAGAARNGEIQARANAFMAATSRHLAAVEDVLVPEVSRLLDDEGRTAADYEDRAKQLEQSMARLKGRLYGEQNAVLLPWAQVWADVEESLADLDEAETRLVEALVSVVEPTRAEELATQVYRAELRAPTRAHPYIPHRGPIGAVARRIWAAADRFWDVTQNRVVPPPIRPRSKRHEHESLMTQFLTGEPNLDAEAPVFEHRRKRRGLGSNGEETDS